MASSAPPSRKRARVVTPQPGGTEVTSLAAALQAVIEEVRLLREEQAHREAQFTEELRRRDEGQAEELRRRDEELQRLRNQLSPSIIRATGETRSSGVRFTFPGAGDERAGPSASGELPGVNGARAFPAAQTAIPEVNDTRTELGYKLKPDTYDGSVPLREFFSQFEIIARANQWSDASRTIALASCLRGKARSILDSVENIGSLEYAELKSKLELRFGEGHLSRNYYSLFTNRRQKFAEDFASLGSELERLARLAYPECPFAVWDKVACSQFISALSDGFVRRTLQLEGVTSLKLAVERAKAVKAIRGENFEDFKKGKVEEEGSKDSAPRAGLQINRGECWSCGEKGHFRSECPSREEN